MTLPFLVEFDDFHHGLWIFFLFGTGNTTFLQELLPFFGQASEFTGRRVESNVSEMNRIIWRANLGARRGFEDIGYKAKDTLLGLCSCSATTRPQSSGVNDGSSVDGARVELSGWNGGHSLGRICIKVGVVVGRSGLREAPLGQLGLSGKDVVEVCGVGTGGAGRG